MPFSFDKGLSEKLSKEYLFDNRSQNWQNAYSVVVYHGDLIENAFVIFDPCIYVHMRGMKDGWLEMDGVWYSQIIF
jgi:hypothetical protein